MDDLSAKRLEQTAREVAADWSLTLGERFAFARHSYVARADHAVLKVTPPEDDEADQEGDALAVWDGDGAVRLLRRDRARRALLIERAVPGGDARDLLEHEAMSIALEVGARLWRPVTDGPFRRARDRVPEWLAAVERTGHSFVPLALRVFEAMTVADRVLVHGDFHHDNLLRHGGRWLAIDPKPLLAEPEFDVVTLLWNPVGVVPTREQTERRIATMAAAGLDERRIRQWAIVRGTYLGLPLDPDETEETARQLTVVRHLIT